MGEGTEDGGGGDAVVQGWRRGNAGEGRRGFGILGVVGENC